MKTINHKSLSDPSLKAGDLILVDPIPFGPLQGKTVEFTVVAVTRWGVVIGDIDGLRLLDPKYYKWVEASQINRLKETTNRDLMDAIEMVDVRVKEWRETWYSEIPKDLLLMIVDKFDVLDTKISQLTAEIEYLRATQ